MVRRIWVRNGQAYKEFPAGSEAWLDALHKCNGYTVNGVKIQSYSLGVGISSGNLFKTCLTPGQKRQLPFVSVKLISHNHMGSWVEVRFPKNKKLRKIVN